ncbi:MAG: glycosyltransferase family 2 protein [Aeromicrobium sp.]
MSESAPVSLWLDDPPTVGAVLVTHNGATWLPKVLASFSAMSHAPDVWRAVDVASADGSAELVRDSFGADRVVRAPRGTGFGDAVRLGLEAMPRTDWIWLLHDDSSVLPGTLSGLLDIATSAPDIAIVGPKIREWPSLRRLLEVGLTITGTGGRETGLEAGEPDAGQHDRPRTVLAVNTAGMLIRRDVWDELDGLDRQLPLYFDDIDIGWRAARAGYRTMTAPSAVIFHAQASTHGVRRAMSGDRPLWERRRAGLFVQLANTGRVMFVWQYVRLLCGSVIRVLGLLIAKDPEAAGDELLAVRSVYAHPLRLLRARKARLRTARRTNRAMGGLFAPAWLPYQHGFDAAREAFVAIVNPETIETVGRRSSLEHTPDHVEDLDEGPPLLQRRPWLVTIIALSVLSLVASRTLLGGIFGGGLSGGALLRAPDTAGGWWSLLIGGDRGVGFAADAWGPLFALPLAVVATPIWFRPDLVVTAVLIFAVPLAGVAAHRLGRRLSPHRGHRIVWALTYAAAVAAVGAVPQGRFGTVVALIVTPIVVNLGLQLAELPRWQTALRLGIWIALGAAFAPVLLPMALLGLALLWFLEGRWVSHQLVLAVLTPLVLLGPWLIDRAAVPWRWWWEAGRPLPGTESLLDIVAGRAGGLQAPWWLSVPVLVLAVVALVPRHTRASVSVAWRCGLIALVVALMGHVVSFEASAGRVDLAPWVAVPSVIWLAALATAALMAAPALQGLDRRVAIAALAAAAVMPLGVGGWWLAGGVDGPVDPSSDLAVPAFLADRPGLTLIITGSTTDGVTYRTVAGPGPFLGQEAFEPSASASKDVTEAVQHLLGRGTDADITTLAAAGVDAIYAPEVEAELARRIDSVPRLEQSGSDDPRSRVWTLSSEPTLRDGRVPAWRRVVAGGLVIVWVMAVLLTTPVRRRRADVVDAKEMAS